MIRGRGKTVYNEKNKGGLNILPGKCKIKNEEGETINILM